MSSATTGGADAPDWVDPTSEELAALRPDPILWEQELAVRPEVAASLARTLGFRAGRRYWRGPSDNLYALELADVGGPEPAAATVYGHWDRWEPRPPEHVIDGDLLAFLDWFADAADGLDAEHFRAVAARAGITGAWPEATVVRTPPERFANLVDFPYDAERVEVEPGLEMAYVEAGPAEGRPILCLHGEPTWGYLYRHMMPSLSGAGRVIVPDLIGFGRSDKPVASNAYTYRAHVRWLRTFVEVLDLRDVTLICQDWGGLAGLRVVAQAPERFERIVAMHTGFPDGTEGAGKAFRDWRAFSQSGRLDVSALMARAVNRGLSPDEVAAYGAPFPDLTYQMGANRFPALVPIRPDHPGAVENRLAAERLRALRLPVLLPWGEDPITSGGRARLAELFPHAEQVTVDAKGHFIQEEAGPEVARLIVDWLGRGS